SNMKKLTRLSFITLLSLAWCFPVMSKTYTKSDIIQEANIIAQDITMALKNNQLSEPQIYAYLTVLTTFAPQVYGSALAFNPQFLQSHAFFLHHNVVSANKVLYCPYVDKDKDMLIETMDIGNIYKNHGYDYTSWEWYRVPMKTHKPHWSKPYFDKDAGDINMVTYSIPIGDKAILTFDLPYDKK
ncbi:MAG: cache domain-containing protein, partial [Pseudomonadota bacterium]